MSSVSIDILLLFPLLLPEEADHFEQTWGGGGGRAIIPHLNTARTVAAQVLLVHNGLHSHVLSISYLLLPALYALLLKYHYIKCIIHGRPETWFLVFCFCSPSSRWHGRDAEQRCVIGLQSQQMV